MAKATDQNATMPEEKKEILIHFLKTENYRSFHVDGMMGAATPKGDFYVELFIERLVTPNEISYTLEESGLKEISRKAKEGFVREIECGLVFDLQTAIGMRDWLNKNVQMMIDLLENPTQTSKSKGGIL
jgi:hypothetical protein